MSGSKSSKRISVFDRLGPGNDESATTPLHRRYSSEKHASASSSQEKVRSHVYGPSVPSAHVRMEERENPPPLRDRKSSRHRGSLGEYPSNLADGEVQEDKRTLNPPPLKSSRDPPEVLKSIGMKVVGRSPLPLPSGESDYESGEEAKRRKGYHGDHDLTRRGKHSADILEEEASRRAGRLSERKEKGHGHLDRPSSSVGHRSSPTVDTTGKTHPRREGVGTVHEHKRRKEDDTKIGSELGHKRKREHMEETYLPEMKKARHGDHHPNSGGTSRDNDRHSGKDSDHYRGSTSKDAEGRHGNMEKKRQLESSPARKHHRSRSPRTPVSGERGRSGGSKTHRHSKEGRKVTPDVVRTSEGSGRSKTLDWSIIKSYTERLNAKLKQQRHQPKEILDKFKPGPVLADIPVSPSLATPECYQKITELVSAHLKEGGGASSGGPWGEMGVEDSVSNSVPTDWDKAVSKSLGPCRRAMTASDDYVLRRLLRKTHYHQQQRSFLPAARSAPIPSTWTNSHYEIGVELYHALPTKPSGTPASRFQPSKVGTLVIAR